MSYLRWVYLEIDKIYLGLLVPPMDHPLGLKKKNSYTRKTGRQKDYPQFIHKHGIADIWLIRVFWTLAIISTLGRILRQPRRCLTGIT
jgi:hypothetical protein